MILLNERSQFEVYIMHHSNHITFWKRQNYGDSEKISGCQELGVGGQRQEGYTTLV